MKKLFFTSFFIIYSLFAMSGNEMITFEYCERANQKGTDGWQGCANKKNCGFDGFYLCTYSKEGLCKQCNFEKYPERFGSCLFCRRPSKKIKNWGTAPCLCCRSNAEEELLGKLAGLDSDPDIGDLRLAIFSFLTDLDHTISSRYIKSFMEYGVYSRVFNDNTPRFYVGAMQLENGNKLHVWKPEIMIKQEDKEYPKTYEEKKKYVSKICKKYNIFGPETGEILLKSIPDDAITYEEKAS